MVSKARGWLQTHWKLLLLVLIVIAAIFYLWPRNYKEHIEKVLEQDRIACRQAPDKPTQLRMMREIELSNCPSDFRDAYCDHIAAWEKTIPLEQRVDEDFGWSTWLIAPTVAFISAVTGQPAIMGTYLAKKAGDYSDIKDEEQRIKKEIHDTWMVVRKIAVGYGARLE